MPAKKKETIKVKSEKTKQVKLERPKSKPNAKPKAKSNVKQIAKKQKSSSEQDNHQKSEMTEKELKSLKKKIAARLLVILAILLLLTFIPAGTLLYWQAWAYFTLVFIPGFFAVRYFFKTDPKFLERRAQFKERRQNIASVVLSSLLMLSLYLVPGLDRRFGWSEVPLPAVIAGLILVLLGYILVLMVFKQNSFAARIIQVEKNQTVVSTGLYAIVRHPMYVGVIIMYMATPVALGSLWGLIPVSFLPAAFVLRILAEEKVLLKELPGYSKYCEKTRYRLIPYIW